MTVTSPSDSAEDADATGMVIETKLEDEYFPEEEEDVKMAVESSVGDVAAGGRHQVPPGVAVEELKNYRGKKDLKNKCPETVSALFDANSKDLWNVYDRMVDAIYKDKTVCGALGKWKDAQLQGVLDQFRDDLLTMYDTANWSGQIIKTAYTKLKFPKGVAVEEFKQWGSRKKLKERIPIYVETLLKEKDLEPEYHQLIDHCIEAGCGSKCNAWSKNKLEEIASVYQPKFASKGVDVYICHKEEYISHGQYGGHMEFFRWIEFVDRSQQPNYIPQRSVSEDEAAKKGCAIS